MDIVADVALRGRKRTYHRRCRVGAMAVGEGLCPRVRPQAGVLRPHVAVLIAVCVAPTVDTIYIGVAGGGLRRDGVHVGGSSQERVSAVSVAAGMRSVEALVHIESFRGLFPGRQKAFIVERSHLVNPAQSLIGLHAAWVVVRHEYPLEMAADTVAGGVGQRRFLMQQ